MKKRLSILSCLLLFAIVAMAQTKLNGIYYNLDNSNNTAEVTYGDSKYSGDIFIPASISVNGATYSVTTIGNYAFYECTGLTSIRIPNSVTTIGEDAFFECDGLTSIEIPSSVATIESGVFCECDGLTSIKIPSSVTKIGNWAFSECSELRKIIVEADNPIYDSRGNCNAIIETASNTLIRGSKETIIPNSVTKIGDGAFSECSGLMSFEIPNSVKTIGNDAFFFCEGLLSIEIPNSVTAIGEFAFSGCVGLARIEIPSSVTKIGNWAFSECSGLRGLAVSADNPIYDSRENCNAIIERASNTLIQGCKNTFIPNSVTTIGKAAFFYCDGLTSIEIPNSVTTIEEAAFYGCSNLEKIYMMSSVPPAVDRGNFIDTQYESVGLYVPKGSLTAYQTADTWKEFWEIKEFDITGIDAITVEEIIQAKRAGNGILLKNAVGKQVAVYDTKGSLVSKYTNYSSEVIVLSKGTYIVVADQKAIKVIL